MNTNIEIEFSNVGKRFGSLWANRDISFSIQKNTIHAIIGENGAGKSTIMKILFGIYPADAGIVKVGDTEVNFQSPIDAMKYKIGMVHQHFMLSPAHTALENVLLVDPEQKPFEFYFKKEKIEKIKATAQLYKFDIPWDTPVKNLGVGVQQKIEILKLLCLDNQILIFDEPTAVLTPHEIDELLNQLLELKKQGKTVILITHKLKEVKRVADMITIFRKGQLVGSYPSSQLDEKEMAAKMVGKAVSFEKRAFERFPDAQTVITLDHVQFKDETRTFNLHLALQRGEILGIAGIEGHGQEKLIPFLLNPKSFKYSGQVLILGRSADSLGNRGARELSVGVFPEDRLRLGVLPELKAFQNFVLGYQRKSHWFKKGFIDWSKVKTLTQNMFDKFKVEPNNIDLTFQSFSGGNQQKIVVARELFHNPDIIIAAHPTRGVDIGAIELIHEQLIQAQEKGKAVLLISSELDELLKLSDRILVIRNGKITSEHGRADFCEKAIGRSMLGVAP
ncbi:MAG: ABC transporter ATP-binding protein [Bdellovibrionaceae bacterium]|nr:ABC transporter ATP-binding protein [Pseudobdellovibrionaceae bacterium]